MKRILLSIILLGFTFVSFAQKADSTWVTTSRIQLKGIVVDHNGHPLKNIPVKAHFAQKSTLTNDSGHFHFQEIQENDIIYVEQNDRLISEGVDGSRFIKRKINLPQEYKLNDSKKFEIKAKRTVQKPVYKIEIKASSFDTQGHFNPPVYAGGLEKFYQYLRANITYPSEAIENNVEGLVKIAFTVKKNGGFKDIEIIRDIGYGCAGEVISVLKKTEKKWYPASNISMVEERVIFDIPFKLTD